MADQCYGWIQDRTSILITSSLKCIKRTFVRSIQPKNTDHFRKQWRKRQLFKEHHYFDPFHKQRRKIWEFSRENFLLSISLSYLSRKQKAKIKLLKDRKEKYHIFCHKINTKHTNPCSNPNLNQSKKPWKQANYVKHFKFHQKSSGRNKDSSCEIRYPPSVKSQLKMNGWKY